MINITDISDDMARVMLSCQKYINLSAFDEMKKTSGNPLYMEIVECVQSKSGQSSEEDVLNAHFIDVVICKRPLTNQVLIDLGVLSYWLQCIDKML